MPVHYAVDIETWTGDGGGLDPTVESTRITSVAIYSGDAAVVFDDHDEARLLRSLRNWLLDESTEPGIIVTWNGANFDMPFLMTRSALCGVELGIHGVTSAERAPKYQACPGHDGGYAVAWGAHDHVDLMYAWREYADAAGIRHGLKPVAQHAGLDPIVVDASHMEALSIAEQCAYNISDVEVTWRLAQMVDITPWLDSKILS